MSKQHRVWAIQGGILILAFTVSAQAAEPGETIFQDDFNGKLAEGWSWEREDRAAWRTGPAGLEVRVQPGNMWGAANNAKNVLVHPIPVPTDAPVEISVTFSNAPTAQWEQANLVWFYDDSNMVKLGQELVTGRFSIVMGREENDRARTVAIIPLDDNTVELRLHAAGNRVRGQFRTRHWSEWRDVGECDLPVKGEPKASLHFYNGAPNEEHWVRANRFAVRRLKPEAANWPRVRVSENTFRIAGGALSGGDRAVLSLGDGEFALANDPGGLAGDAKANCEQRIFRHQDGSCGWSWDRRGSASRQPILLGIGLGEVDPGSRKGAWFPLEVFQGAGKTKPFEMEVNAVTRLENDAGDHNLSVHLWLTAAVPRWPLTHRISILFDWYGKEATGSSVSDGYRDYEYLENRPKPSPGLEQFQYRIRGFRGAPPKVNLRAFVADAARRGLPDSAAIAGVWFGNEVWDGSRGGTLVTQLDFVLDGKRYSSLPNSFP
jgi:regulation of enolase protein 1 (concanavalin A-like superfamily)